MAEFVHLQLSNGVATITLDSQHNRNALSRQLVEELDASLDAAEAGQARAIVLRHEGPAFCAGADLKERTDQPTDSSPMVSILKRLMDTERPTISAVDGAVRAGGIGLMAACDLVVVNTATTFALTEVRIGVAAAIISVPILQRVPPGKIAAAMVGRSVSMRRSSIDTKGPESAGASDRSFRSAPAQNAGPSWRSTIARAAQDSAASMPACNSPRSWRDSALRLCWESSVIVATPSVISTWTTSGMGGP